MNQFPFVFAHPWGALALLGVPVVVAIHCLQLKSRILRISTLFLLERLAPDSKEGRRFTWLRTSLPFWLQLFCVLVLSWILLDPRWLRTDAVQRVVVVLDSSLSMNAFTGDLVARTEPRLRALASLTPHTHWTLLETDPDGPTLYEGTDLDALEKKMQAWRPSLPAHDPAHALELARSLAPGDAVLIFVTDRPHDLPSGIDLLAIGRPIENCGLVGSRLEGDGDDLEWRVVVQNYGQKTAHRSWWIEMGGEKTQAQKFDLDPGHPMILKGKFPPGLDRLEVCLDPDPFTLDDRMAIVRPQPKRLAVDLRGDDATTDLFVRLSQTLPALAAAQPGQAPDLAFVTTNPRVAVPDDARVSLVLLNDPLAKDQLQGEPFTVEDDPLNQDLNWQGLVMQPGLPLQSDPSDHVLVWKDRAPVIFVRTNAAGHRQLVFNFNFPASNASRLPAFVLLISRFIESARADKMAPETRNAELTEPLSLAVNAPGDPVVLHRPDGSEISSQPRPGMNLRAPSLPGFFSITQGDRTVLTGAAQFADARESDFTTAASIDTLAMRRAKLVEQRTQAEAMTPLWILLVGVLLMLNWRATSSRTA